MVEVCWHQEELVCWWLWCTQASMIPTDTNSFWQGWKSRKRKKKKCSRKVGRKKEVRKNNAKEKAVSTRWSIPGVSLQFLCRQQFPCKSMGDAGYSVLLPVRLQLDWDAYVWNRIPSSGQIFLQILMLECFYPVTWRDGAFMLPHPTFSIVQSLNQGSSQVLFHCCNVCSLTVHK